MRAKCVGQVVPTAMFLLTIASSAMADACMPSKLVQRNSQVELLVTPANVGGKVVVKLQHKFILPIAPGALEIASSAKFSNNRLITQKPVEISASLTRAHVTRGASISMAQGEETWSGPVTVKHGDSYFSLPPGESPTYPVKPHTYPYAPLPHDATDLTLPEKTEVTLDAEKRPQLDRGTEVHWTIDPSLPKFLLLSSAYLEKRMPPSTTVSLVVDDPSRVPAGGTLKVGVRGADRAIDFATSLNFCIENGDEQHLIDSSRVTVSETKGNTAELALTIPDEVESGMWRSAATLRLLSVDDQDSGAEVDIVLSNALSSGLLSAGTLLLFILFLRFFAGSRNLLRGWSGRMSLANFQIVIWTVVVLFSYFYVWLATGLVVEVDHGILGLLGISTAAKTVSTGVAIGKRNTAPSAAEPASAGPATAQTAGTAPGMESLKDLVSTDGRFDVLRFQMLGLNLFAWVYALSVVVDTQSLPQAPESLYWLLGISGSGYVGGKVVRPSATPSSDYEAGLTGPQIREIQIAIRAPETGALDAVTRAKIRAYQEIKGIMPVEHHLTELLHAKMLSDHLINVSKVG